MPYIITNGTVFCVKTNRQAVQIVDSADAATRFALRDEAEKLLLRATRKLKGFHIEEAGGEAKIKEDGTNQKSSRQTGEKAPGRRRTNTGRTNAGRTGKTAGKRSEKQPPQDTASREDLPESAPQTAQTAPLKDEKPGKLTNEVPSETAESAQNSEDTNAVSEKKPRTSRSSSRRGRPRKNTKRASETHPAADSLMPEENASEAEKSQADGISEDVQAAGGSPEAAASETLFSMDREAAGETQTAEDAQTAEDNLAVEDDRTAEAAAENAADETRSPADNAETGAGEAQAAAASAQEHAREAQADEADAQEHAREVQADEANVQKLQPADSEPEDAAKAGASAEVTHAPSGSAKNRSFEDDIQAASARLWASPTPPPAEKKSAASSKSAAAAHPVSKPTPDEIQAASARLWGMPPAAPVREKNRSAESGKPSEEFSEESLNDSRKDSDEDFRKKDPTCSQKDSSHSDSSMGRNQDSAEQTSPSRSRRRRNTRPAQPGAGEEQSTASAPESPAVPAGKESDGKSHARPSTGTSQTGGYSRQRRMRKSQPALRSRNSSDTGESTSAVQTTKRRFFTQKERNLIYNRTEGHCGICGRFIPLEEYTIDHIIPLSKGGTNDLDNLQACCSFCNKAKDDSMGDDFFDRIERIFLYQAKLKYGKKQMKKLKKALRELD